MFGVFVAANLPPMTVERFVGLDGFAIALVGTLLAAVALAVAIFQLRHTQTALEAATDAIETTQRSLATNQLLTLIPQLQRIETELDDAAREDDRKAGHRLLVAWRNLATDAQGVLAGHPARDVSVEEPIRTSIVQVTVAKANLIEKKMSCKRATETARAAIAAACADLGVFAGNLKNWESKTYPRKENHE
jgi:hypothetical protein